MTFNDLNDLDDQMKEIDDLDDLDDAYDLDDVDVNMTVASQTTDRMVYFINDFVLTECGMLA